MVSTRKSPGKKLRQLSIFPPKMNKFPAYVSLRQPDQNKNVRNLTDKEIIRNSTGVEKPTHTRGRGKHEQAVCLA